MEKVITIHEAKTHLSKYIKEAKGGVPVYIGSYGAREVMLVSALPKPNGVKFGTLAGKFSYKEGDVMGIDPDIQAMFYGEDAATGDGVICATRSV
jgi:antitoxin (DNA-binding transcriptional repressor) of toxin-antitoxin stability system